MFITARKLRDKAEKVRLTCVTTFLDRENIRKIRSLLNPFLIVFSAHSWVRSRHSLLVIPCNIFTRTAKILHILPEHGKKDIMLSYFIILIQKPHSYHYIFAEYHSRQYVITYFYGGLNVASVHLITTDKAGRMLRLLTVDKVTNLERLITLLVP